MLIKILLCVFLSIIQFSAHAYVLLSSKTTVSPGCEGGVLEHITDSHPILSNDSPAALTASKDARGDARGGFLTASTDARAFSTIGYARQMTTLQSSHSFSIQNNTKRSQAIKVNVKLSAHDGTYTNNEYTYQLRPEESMNDSTTLYFNKQYAKPGNYKIYAHTTVTGDIRSSASDSRNVTIR